MICAKAARVCERARACACVCESVCLNECAWKREKERESENLRSDHIFHPGAYSRCRANQVDPQSSQGRFRRVRWVRLAELKIHLAARHGFFSSPPEASWGSIPRSKSTARIPMVGLHLLLITLPLLKLHYNFSLNF